MQGNWHSGPVTCKICQRIFSDIRGLAVNHLRQIHKMTPQQYYDLYFKSLGEDICREFGCGNLVRFKSITQGYRKFCSVQCLGININRQKKGKPSTRQNYHVSEEVKQKMRLSKIEYYKTPESKLVLCSHHIDLNDKNEIETNKMKLTRRQHNNIHREAYRFVVEQGLIHTYIEWWKSRQSSKERGPNV